MYLVLPLACLWLSAAFAPAAVVVVKVEQRLSELPGFPGSAGLDVDSDGVVDLLFRTSSWADPGGAVDYLQLQPQSGEQLAYLGNSTLQSGSLLGPVLPVVNPEGDRGAWSNLAAGICSRTYSFQFPGETYQHLGKGNNDACGIL